MLSVDCGVLPLDLGRARCRMLKFSKVARQYKTRSGVVISTPKGRTPGDAILLAQSSSTSKTVEDLRLIIFLFHNIPSHKEVRIVVWTSNN
jgi:hypothetical protein